MGGGGFVAGPVGLAALSQRIPLVLDRGRQPPGPRQPAARCPRSPSLPRLPDRGSRRRALPGHRAPRAAGGRRGGSDRLPRPVRDPRRRPLPAGGRRQPGGPLGELLRARGLRGRPGQGFRRHPRVGDSRLPRAARAPRAARPRGLCPPSLRAQPGGEPRGERPRPRALGWVAVRVRRRPGGPPCSCPTRMPLPITRPRTPAGWRARAPPWSLPTATSRRSASAARSVRSSATTGAWSECRRPPVRWPGPMPPPGSPARSSPPRAHERAGTPLHRHRWRRDERPGARLRSARRRRGGQRPGRVHLHAAPPRGRDRGSDRSRRRQPSRAGRGRRLDRDRRGQPGAGGGGGARGHDPPPRSAAGGAVRSEAPDRGFRHPREDDDDGDADLGDAGPRARSRLLPRRRAARGGARRRARQLGVGGGGVGRRRGRRERRQLPSPRARDRRGHQRRDGPSLPLGIPGRAGAGLRGLHRARAGSRPPCRGRPRPPRRGPRGWPSSTTMGQGRPGSSWRSLDATTCSTPARRSPLWSWPGPTSMPRRGRSATSQG